MQKCEMTGYLIGMGHEKQVIISYQYWLGNNSYCASLVYNEFMYLCIYVRLCTVATESIHLSKTRHCRGTKQHWLFDAQQHTFC